MSNETRPFEVGDLVVLDNGSVGDVERYEPLMFPCPKIFVKTGIYTSVWIEVNNIKTIRKPRKGSKEARDIVAMLARKYKSLLHDYLEYWHWHDQNASDDDIKKYWNHRRDGGQFRNHERYLTFQTAKSMLK